MVKVAPDPSHPTGQAICAFVILKEHHAEMSTAEMVNELRAEVAREISPIAKPREIHVDPELPKTRSGKIKRRLLRDVAEGRELGDTSTLVDPTVFEAIRASKARPAPRARKAPQARKASVDRRDPRAIRDRPQPGCAW